jgi:SAM-dependent methyltransferase
MTDQDRLEREQQFHDSRFGAEGEGDHRPADRFYAINRASDQYFRVAIRSLAPGQAVLDYGCGAGAYAAIEAAKNGHWVVAVDLSPIAIEEAREVARQAGVEDHIDFRVMNAEQLTLDPASFDFVCGLGVLHHLDIAAALREITRVMKPTARAVFVEPMGHNPVINAYRNRTPAQRTPDEHPLLMDDFPLFRARFGSVEASYFHLLGLLALPLSGTRFLDPALTTLDRADQSLLRTRARRWAWMVGLEVAGPRPDAA